MFNKMVRSIVINEMTTQGKQYTEQELFFKEFWDELRKTFSEENNTSSATFVLERFLKVLPLKTIGKQAMINTIKDAYNEKNKVCSKWGFCAKWGELSYLTILVENVNI